MEFVCNDGIIGADVRQNLRDLINEEQRATFLGDFDEFLLDEDDAHEVDPGCSLFLSLTDAGQRRCDSGTTRDACFHCF